MSENVGKRDAEAVPSQPGDATPEGAATAEGADDAQTTMVPNPTPPADEAAPTADATPEVAPPAQRSSVTNSPLPAQQGVDTDSAATPEDRQTVIGSPSVAPADQADADQRIAEVMADAPTMPSPVTNPLPDQPETPTVADTSSMDAADEPDADGSDLDTVALATSPPADHDDASELDEPTDLDQATGRDDAAAEPDTSSLAAADTELPAADAGKDTVAMVVEDGEIDPAAAGRDTVAMAADADADSGLDPVAAGQDTVAMVAEDGEIDPAVAGKDTVAMAADADADADIETGLDPAAAGKDTVPMAADDTEGANSAAAPATDTPDADQAAAAQAEADQPGADQKDTDQKSTDQKDAGTADADQEDAGQAASDVPGAEPSDDADAADGQVVGDAATSDGPAAGSDPGATEVILPGATEAIATDAVASAATDDPAVTQPLAAGDAADGGETVKIPAGDRDLDTAPMDASAAAAALADQDTDVLPRGTDATADAERRSALAGLAQSPDAPPEPATQPLPGQPAQAQETVPLPSDRDDSAAASTVQQDIVHDGVPKPAQVHEPASNRMWLIGGATALLLTGVVYVGTAAAMANRIPASATVGGVPVAGQNKDQLREKLQQKSDELAQQPITLSAGDVTAEVIPQDAGLVADPQATVDQFDKFSLNPIVIWNKLTGRGDYQFITAVDDAKLQTAVDQAAGEINRNPVEPEVTFEGAAVKKVDAADGYVLDVPGTKDAIRDQWPAASTIDAPREVNSPNTSQDALDLVMNDFVNPVVAGPITIKTAATSGSKQVALEPAAFTPAISIVAEEGVMSPKIDGEKLTEIAIEKNKDLVVEPKDASVEMSGGKPAVVPGVKGETLDPESLTQQFISAATTPERVAQVTVTEADPEITTAKLESLLVPQSMYKFESKMPVNGDRTHNIKLAAGTINGTLLMPGETFSMNETLGRRTSAKGYRAAGVIMKGKMSKDVGGGISQLATTLFNTMFFSGLDEVEHKPHSFYISRYPEGREATVNYPTVDLKFTNDTPKAVYIQTGVSGQTVWAQFWGEKQYSEITAAKGKRRNIRQPKVIEDDSEGCVKQSPAAGFDVTVSRIFKNGGAEVKRESFKHRYIPKDHIKCTAGQKPPPAAPGPAPAPPAGGPAGAGTPAVPPPGDN